MLGDKLKELRESKKITQQDMANVLGIARGTYAHYEINRREPDNDTLKKIANYFNVSTDYLLDRISMPNNTLIQKQYKDEQAERFYPINNDLLEGIPEKDKADALRDIEAFREFFKTKYKNLKK